MKSIEKLFLIMTFYVLVSVQPALAQASTPSTGTVTDNQVNAIAKQLYCPVCENTPLDVCPTQACEEWRGLIRDMLSEGKTEAQIKEYFVQQYGDRVLGTPPPRGINWLIYIFLPVFSIFPPVSILIVILIGIYILYRVSRVRHEPASPLSQPIAPPESSDEYVQRLEEELRKR